MKKKITTLFLLALGATTYAQDGPGIGIGTQIPNQAAALEIHATKKGVLIPRLTIGDLKTFGLDGEAVEGVLVYNKTAKAGSTTAPVVEEIKVGFHYWSKADGGKWQLITSQSQLDQVVSEIKNDFNTKIDNINNKIETIINGGTKPGQTRKDFMVVFEPESADANTGKLKYLVPNTPDADGNITYKQNEISFGELVQTSETETFIVPADATGKTVADIKLAKMFVYYGEKAVREWAKNNASKDPKKDMTLADGGIKVDVVGAITSNFSDIINNTENKLILQQFIANTPGGLTLDTVKKEFVIKKEGEADVTVSYSDINTLTAIKGYEDKDGDGLKDKPAITAKPTDKAKGTVVYEYVAEDGKSVFINITEDVINSVTNNETLKKQIFKTVNEYTKIEGGGNVYYGYISDNPDPTKDKLVLFTMDADKNKNEINIAQDIIKEINTNTEVKETINKLIKVNVSSEPAYTHHLINTKAVFKVATTAEVVGGTPEGATVVVPYNSKFSAEIATKKIDKLLSVQISQGDKLLVTNVTDVVKTANGVSFNFGIGKMYQVLPAGKYDVVVEYISTLTEKEVDTMNQ